MSASRASDRGSTGPAGSAGQSGGAFGSDAESYRLLIDTLPAFIWTSRPDGGIEFCNRRLLEYAGRSLEEVAGESWRDLVHPDDLQHVVEARARILRTGESSEVECRLRRGSDGSYLWFLVRGEPMRNAAGEITRWCGTATNIEGRKCNERALESLAALLRHSQRSAHVGSYLVEWADASDRDSYRVQWSDELFRIFGYDPGVIEPSLEAWTRRLHPDERHRVVAALEEALQHRRGLELEYHIVRDDGVHTLYTWAEFDAGPPPRFWGTCQDVTEQRHAATELREADRRKNEFLATLAHELRNPLAPIRQSVVVAQSPRASEAQRQRSFEIIERQVAHMARLIEDLVEASRISRGRLELRLQPTTLGAVLLAAVETARPMMEARNQTLCVDVPEEPIELNGDPVRLAQVFINLLTNAAKYTDPHGRIDLRVGVEEGQAVVSVRDNGIGISPVMLPRVFDLFSQANTALERTEGGLGIGLALARGIVALHGGRIEAHSAGLGRGSEFIVILPTQPSSAPPLPTSVASAEKAQLVYRILVADDNADAAESLAMTLKLRGHEVEIAHDGRRALEIAALIHPQIALLDIGMPELNGYELARQIRSHAWGQHMKLVAVTGWGQDEDRRQALAAGFDEHLTKPIDPRRLMSVIEAATLLPAV
ncbi:MAG TPA: PAS domain-containing protein [Steroidobacteraceae bacterium]|nr:PAS domain-containing protein [Steroidobacteraceae bacterium]